MRLDGTDLASADGATNRTSLLVLRSRPRLVPEKYFPVGFTLCRSDAGGHVRPIIRKTLLHEDASDGVESSANIYKRRSTSTLSIQNRSTVLHASFEKTKMGVYINLRSQEQAMCTLRTRLQEMGASTLPTCRREELEPITKADTSWEAVSAGDPTLTKSNQTLPKSVAQTLEMAKSRNWLDRKL